jgi:2-oxo-4-hydroxy-4-carboxy-5-ureidoimidazoline decarboxylase
MSILDAWNQLPEREAIAPILACCGSSSLAAALVRTRPFAGPDPLFAAADHLWWSLPESDWLEAFACHPRIGESRAHNSSQFSAWSTQEQSQVRSAEAATLDAIAQKNYEYEQRHGFIYIVCAIGKSADELLTILDRRLANSTEVEMKEAAEQQRQITQLRLRKWLNQ